MMHSLWDIAPPARRGEETQAAGAVAIARRAPLLRARVLAYIRARGASGATNEEIAAALGLRLCTVCGRIGELRAQEQIRDSGLRRPNNSGVEAKVWRPM